MRENRPYGSEGGESGLTRLPYPYHSREWVNQFAVCRKRITLSTVVNLFDPLEALPKHESWLRTVLLSRLGNRDEVEDVMQEVAVAVANQSARFVAVEQAGPWLYRVAIRQMLQFRRKAGRYRRLLNNAGQYQSLRPNQLEHQSPLVFLLHIERQEAVRSAFA